MEDLDVSVSMLQWDMGAPWRLASEPRPKSRRWRAGKDGFDRKVRLPFS
jgi:hypothetical protein